MKDFKKTSDGLFICEECGKTFKICSSLSAHVGKFHNKKEYYDKWIKTETEDICPTCGNKTKYLNRWDRGYNMFCSKKCKRITEETKIKIQRTVKKTCNELYGVDNFMSSKEFKEKCKQTWLNNYGVDNPGKSKEIIDKRQKTKKEKYGDENYNNTKKRKQTNLEKYGGSSPFHCEKVKQKAKKTCIDKYGVDHPFKSKKIIKKREKTWIKNYGVDNPNKNQDVVTKGINSRLKTHKFKNSNLHYQSSYEYDFLERYFDKFLNIKRGPTIKYFINDLQKLYFPDFFIPELNLIIECKSSWTYNKEVDTKKKDATINSGFNYLMIKDKDYREFDNLYLA